MTFKGNLKKGLGIFCLSLCLYSCKKQPNIESTSDAALLSKTKKPLVQQDHAQSKTAQTGQSLFKDDEHHGHTENNRQGLEKKIGIMALLQEDLDFGDQNQIKVWSINESTLCVWTKDSNTLKRCEQDPNLQCIEDTDDVCQTIPVSQADIFIETENNTYVGQIKDHEIKKIASAAQEAARLNSDLNNDLLELVHIAVLAENFIGVEMAYEEFSLMLMCHEDSDKSNKDDESDIDHGIDHDNDDHPHQGMHCEGNLQPRESIAA